MENVAFIEYVIITIIIMTASVRGDREINLNQTFHQRSRYARYDIIYII